MEKRLIESLQEAVAYAKGDKSKEYEAKASVPPPVEIPRVIDKPYSQADLGSYDMGDAGTGL